MGDRTKYFRDYHQRRQKDPVYRERKRLTALRWWARKRMVKRLLALPHDQFVDAYLHAISVGDLTLEDLNNGKDHKGRRGPAGKGVALAQTFDHRAAYARRKATAPRD